MSCEIKPLAKICDLRQIQEQLGFSQNDAWLNSVYYSLSPSGELLTIAHGNKVMFLSSRWDNDIQQNKYTITWNGDIQNFGDIITAVVCLPVIGLSTSVQVLPEWTCVAVGLSSGLVKFYSDSGLELYSQQWHNEPVQNIKVQSGKRKHEELHISYLTCVCIVQGNHIIQLLRGLKLHLEKAKSSKTDLTGVQESILCRKWSYGGKCAAINDTVVVGLQKICTFDHLLTASMEGGFYAKYKSAPPQVSLVIGVGQKPYAGFHWAKEGFVQPVLADVARAVASKIKSALPTWLMGTQPPMADAPPPLVPAEPMSLRFGLCDIQRTGLAVWLAPDNNYAAVTDNLGRVMLIDCFRGIAIRVWKGYREAQCSFIKVTEKLQKSTVERPDRRHALFLVIFAPRRSCLEIWGLQRGQKVAAFNASKFGQLIYNSYSLMGTTAASKVKQSAYNCVFLDPTDQTIKEIIIPFHCALSDSNSKTAKDLHLLRRIKLCLRSGDGSDADILEEITISCNSLQTDEIRLQCIEMLIKNSKIKPTALAAALNEFTKLYEDTDGTNKETEEMIVDDDVAGVDEFTTAQLQYAQLKALSTNYKRLVEFYMYAVSSDGREKFNSDADEIKLNISVSELENLQKFIDLNVLERATHKSHSRVTFNEKVKSNAFIDYLSVFNCSIEDNDEMLIRLKEDKQKLYATVGFDIYNQFLMKGKCTGDFLIAATESGISADDLIRLFLYYWLDKPFAYTKSEDVISELIRFTGILQQICALAHDKIAYEYNAISYWWQFIREILLESPHSLMGLLAAMMCRNHSVKFRQRENSQDNEMAIEEGEEVWEQVSQEAAEWSLLIDKLDDVAALDAILNFTKSEEIEEICPILSYEAPNISLKTVVCGGKGIVSELTAKWILSFGIDPILLLEQDEATNRNTDNQFVHYLHILREHFPFSLQSGVLLIHMIWEYMCHWSKNMSRLDYFKAALACLDTIKSSEFAIKHGICCMIWNAHLKIPLEATKKLINKTGRLPKEKLCLQDIGLSDTLVPDFLEHCTAFLKHFSGSIQHEKMDLRYEEILQEGAISLSLLAIEQNIAIIELVKLHEELVDVLYIIASLNIKYPKPIQCVFSAVGNQMFFTEINLPLSHEMPKADFVLVRKRNEFMTLAISATMDLIREDLEGVYLNDHIQWMEFIENLSNTWQLDTNALKKHQIVELYAYGWDSYAEEQLESVLDTESLGSLLLKIAGRRLNIFTKNSPNAYIQVAAVGPLVTDYLDTIHNSSDHLVHRGSNDISLENLIKLTGKAFNCLAKKDSRELKIAGQMFDACHILKEYLQEKN